MFRPLTLVAAFGLAVPALAADLDAQYTAIGTMTAVIDGQTHDLVVVRDTASGDAMAAQRKFMGYLSLNVVGAMIGEDGRPTIPNVQVTLMDQSGSMGLLSAEVFDDQGYDAPMVMGDDGGTGKLTAYSFEDNRLEATLEGEFLRLQGYMSEPKPADGAQPVPVTLTVSVDMPPLEE